MNRYELLEVIGEAKEEYVLDALKTRQGRAASSRVVSMKKAALVAAVIGLMLLLAGCAAVFLWLRDMSIAQEPYVAQFDAYGKAVEPTEVTREVLSLTGLSGSPVQMAAKEWYAFCEGYDPDGELLTNTADDPNIPNNCEYTYHCYTQEMVDKLHEITEKYGLKLLDSGMVVQDWQWQAAFEGIGLDSLFRPEGEVEVTHQAGTIFTSGSYWMDVSFRLTGEGTLWKTPVSARAHYHPKGYMAPPHYLIVDPGSYEEWTYTASDGTRLLLALGNNGTALIVADRGDAVISVSLTISAGHLMSEHGAAPTKAVVEQLADVFDYGVKPVVSDAEALSARLAEVDEAYWAERNAVIPVSYTGFGDYLKANALRLRKNWYTYYDLDGNGEQDLLISDDQETFFTCVFSFDGELKPCSDGLPMCLLENGGVVRKHLQGLDVDAAANAYYAPIAQGVALRPGDEEYLIESGKFLEYVGPDNDNNWIYSDSEEFYLDKNRREITEGEARAVMEQYPVVELNWMPITEHPLGDEITVGDYLAQIDVRLPDHELKAKYGELTAEVIEKYQYCRFNLVDINGDGVLDLLVGSDSLADIDPDTVFTFWSAYTYRYGTLMKLKVSDFYLCREGVLEKIERQPVPGGSRRIRHTFMRLEDSEVVVLADILYDLSSDTWMQAETEETIGTDEANGILEQYARIDQGMRPIGELYG